ncbi:DNA methyltransferase [Roseospira visakhapatnamensis]|uniref:Methyltransferase n=1 Tax=Roseospira visakhapatnamensis TaxID=390880 RepID=A0A7W6RA82_9PROT|nr:DNA modification methylase [Roseospira visakhapatnamensis]
MPKTRSLHLIQAVPETDEDVADTAEQRDPAFLTDVLDAGVVQGDASVLLRRLHRDSVDLFFLSPPYADARTYSEIHPDRYVEWFLPFARAMFDATKQSGSMIVNIKNRVASRGPLKGQRHPYVYQLVLALQHMGWRWIETYIWAKPNAVPGRFGPRAKDAFEYVYHFARGSKPYFDLNAVRVPYRADTAEIARRKLDTHGRRNTAAGFGRDRTKTYLLGGADPGNVVSVPQTYNQHHGVAHTAAMPEGLAAFFVQAACPEGGVVLDPFAGSGTTVVVAKRYGRMAGGFELHEDFVKEATRRIKADIAEDLPGQPLRVDG